MNDGLTVEEMSERICRVLSERGCVFDWEADGRGAKQSRYIFVRRPRSMKIRVGTHPSDRIEKERARSRHPIFDVGPHAMTCEEAVTQIVKELAP